jgi:hypothetical protein
VRSIQDHKKKKTKEKKPIVTSQDPDFPESLLGGTERRLDGLTQRKIDWLLDNGFYQRPNDGKNSRTQLEAGTNNQHRFIFLPDSLRGESHYDLPIRSSLWERSVGPNEFENYFLYEHEEEAQPTYAPLKPIGPEKINTSYEQPEIIETPPTPMLTGRQAVQIGRVAHDRDNARYGQVLDKEYYWDDDLKRWQMRPVDEERLGKPFPKDDRKYRLIKASF